MVRRERFGTRGIRISQKEWGAKELHRVSQPHNLYQRYLKSTTIAILAVMVRNCLYIQTQYAGRSNELYNPIVRNI